MHHILNHLIIFLNQLVEYHLFLRINLNIFYDCLLLYNEIILKPL